MSLRHPVALHPFSKQPYKLEKTLYFAEETCNFKEPTNRSHPIVLQVFKLRASCPLVLRLFMFLSAK